MPIAVSAEQLYGPGSVWLKQLLISSQVFITRYPVSGNTGLEYGFSIRCIMQVRKCIKKSKKQGKDYFVCLFTAFPSFHALLGQDPPPLTHSFVSGRRNS